MFDSIDNATDSEVFESIGRYETNDIGINQVAVELSSNPKEVREILNQYDIEVRERSIDEIVQEVANCFDSDEDEDLSGEYYWNNSDQKTVSNGVSEMIERASINFDEFPISEVVLRRKIRDMIWESKTEDGETADVFESKLDDLPRRLGTQDWPKFKIVFPLNIIYHSVDRPDEYEVLNEKIEALTDSEWDSFSSEAFESEQRAADESEAIGDFNDLERLLSDSPNSLDRGDQTHWIFETEAIDQRYAIDRCQKILTFIMGRINFALTRNRSEGDQMNSSTWNTRWMKLRDPFIYLIFKGDDYFNYFYSTDPSPRKPITLSAHKARRYEEYLDVVPELNKTLNSQEEQIISGINSFQDAVTSSRRRDIFLNYWRAIENLTLSSRDHSTGDIAERSRTVATTSSGIREPEVVDKRNRLVHEPERTEITTDDTNLLKDRMEELILKYIDKRNDWSHSDFEFFFSNGNKSQNSLEQMERNRERELELIGEIGE